MKQVFLVIFAIIVSSTSIILASGQPNIVLIISDDQAWTDYGFMGHPTIKTPNLDRLAQESIVFKHGYVPTGLCRPSLLTIATGHYAHRHGITGNNPSFKYAKPFSPLYNKRRGQLISYIDKLDTLPELLATKGYLSHQSGKWWEGSFQRGGFSHGMTRGFPHKGGRHGDDGLKIGREGLQPIYDFVDMAKKKNKPFFLWYAPFLPHKPHNPPQKFLQKYSQQQLSRSIARYYAMCSWFDETCGELIDYLEKKELRDNTIIVYVCDNGWIQQVNGDNFAPRSKRTCYEAGIRTPIMFSWPKRWKACSRGELVSSIDIFPSILGVVGIKPKPDLPGLNLVPYLEGQKKIDRKFIFGERFAHDIADIANPEASLLTRWCIEDDWKLMLFYDGEINRAVHPHVQKGPQLFNLTQDPHEQKNVATENPEIVSRLTKKISDWYPLKERKVFEE